MTSKRRAFLSLCAGVCISVFTGIAAASLRMHVKPTPTAQGGNLFSSHLMPQEAVSINRLMRIPFTLQGGLICVRALINERPVECVIDTGSYAIVWPRTARLTGLYTGLQSEGWDALGNSHRSEQVILPRLEVGGYVLENVPGFVLDTLPTHGSEPRKGMLPFPLLGNSAFKSVVLTIDYRTKIITIERGHSSKSRAAREHGKFDHDFSWALADTHDLIGVPVVHGEIDGHPANIIVDCGLAGPAMGITRRFAASLPAFRSDTWVWARSNMGMRKVAVVKSLSLSLPTIRMNQPAVIVERLYSGTDAVIGTAVLRHFLVTIDYPDRVITLKPYD